MSSVILRTTFTALAAVLGALLGLTLGRAAQARLNLLLAAATGTLLAVVLCDVLPDAKEYLPWAAFLVATLSGYGLFYLFNRYVYHICPACAYSEFDSGTIEKLAQTAVLLMVALGVHSMLDGVAIVVGDHINKPNPGVLLALALHKLPEGLALVVLLLSAGYTRRTSLLWTTAIEATTVLGGVLGFWSLQGASPFLIGFLFAFVGGGFLFLIVGTFRALWGNTAQSSTLPLNLIGIFSFAGMAGLLSLIRVFAH